MPANPKIASFPIVGIGGSAGGLEAFQRLLKSLSAKPGMAFVFIMHLAPEHKSMLSELLARATKMPVSEVKSGMPIEVNHVYVIPPKTTLSIASGKLVLNNLKETGLPHMTIDFFFRSLAEEQGNKAIGVILSGTATDGTLGAEAIKAEGGITFAQDEKSAKYAGMPQSAVSAGCVDFVLPTEKIASELERIAKHPYISRPGPVKTAESIIPEGKGFESIFDILRHAKGLDFTHYKTATIGRRVLRRMVLLKLNKLEHYVKFLRGNKDEVGKLYEDLLINVTNFFRDPKVFDTLKKQVLPAILKNKKNDQEVRIWVPGCSSGEEAYSIAICILETLDNKAGTVPVQIFATDVSEGGINKARRGIYGENIKNNITPERLKRFFTKGGNSYRVSKQLRDLCVISKQNVFSDPPFSNIDLISCRNLLIYLQPVLQKAVFDKFHYALRTDGFLLLGNSEAAGDYSNLFKTLDRRQKIFVKKYLSVRPELEFGQKYYLPKKLEIKENTDSKKETEIAGIVDRVVLSEYAPCGVLIDSDMKVVQFRGHTGRYLESSTGKPSLDLFKLTREGLFLALRAAIYKARKTKHTVKREAENVKYNGHRMRVNITVIPVKSETLKEELFLVLFDEMAKAVGSKNLPRARGKISLKGKSVKSDEYINNLQKELAETKEYLRSVIEEQESAEEEIKSANEELLSGNEELQSTNEELETAKEELQSSNEELITANDELQNRNAEVSLLNNDLINLLSSINMPVIMMGTDLTIRRITSQAEKALNVIPSDIGRPISKIKLNVDIPDLEKILLGVIESLHPKTLEIKSGGGNWYSVYIRPYRTIDNKIDGVVAIFVDITERQKAQQIIKEARAYAENIIETMREPLIVLGDDLKVISANRAFYQTFNVTPKETQGQFIYDLGNRQWDIPKLRQLLEEILPKESTFDNYEIEHNFETIGLKVMLLNARRLATMRMILITIDDITERKQAAEEALRLNEVLKKLNQIKSDFVSNVSHELRTPLTTMKEFTSILLDEIPGKLTKEQKEYVGIIKGNIDRLARLINNLLDISKIEAGRVELKKALVGIANLSNSVIYTLKPEAEGKHIELKTLFPAAALNVYADPDMVIQVFNNLIGNAIKFTKEFGQITVEIKDAEKEAVCSVADTGRGIAPENLDKLFGKFRQFDREVGSGAKGTGLGLAISKELVEMHHGRIWAESKIDKGSKFTFTLPKYSTKSLFEEYVDKGIKEAVKNGSKMSIIMVSLLEFEKLKQELSIGKLQTTLKDMEGVLAKGQRRQGDIALKDTDGIIVILTSCDKKSALTVEGRLEKALGDYLTREKLDNKIELRLACATYPDEAKDANGLIEKARTS